jgi:hypothetical protein
LKLTLRIAKQLTFDQKTIMLRMTDYLCLTLLLPPDGGTGWSWLTVEAELILRPDTSEHADSLFASTVSQVDSIASMSSLQMHGITEPQPSRRPVGLDTLTVSYRSRPATARSWRLRRFEDI